MLDREKYLAVANNKTNSSYRQEHDNIVRYYYLTMATCFGLSLGHLQANVPRKKIQPVSTMYSTIISTSTIQ